MSTYVTQLARGSTFTECLLTSVLHLTRNPERILHNSHACLHELFKLRISWHLFLLITQRMLEHHQSKAPLMQRPASIEHRDDSAGWQTEAGGTQTRVPQPWERTDKGKQWPNSGSFGRERESEQAWAWPWEKSGNPLGEAALTRQGETYGSWAGERLTLLGTLSQMSCQDAAFSTPTNPSSPNPTAPDLLWTHTHSQCSPHPASGQRLPGSFPPITLPSLWKLIDGSNGDGQMLKLVWRLNSGCHCNIPRLPAPFIIHLDILENIPSNWSSDNKRIRADIVSRNRVECCITSVFAPCLSLIQKKKKIAFLS